MTPNAIRWEVPPLSTRSVQAAIHYRDGIAALVAGAVNADRVLAEAVVLDPSFVLARVGVAVCHVVDGGPYRPPPLTPGLVARGERQHAEVVETTFNGAGGHAADLRREHLLEFPGDVLIVWLPVLRVPASSQSRRVPA